MDDRYPLTGQEDLDTSSLHALKQAEDRMKDNYPYAHPLYAGQMLKPPHVVARMAYHQAQKVNPNNHALDGGRASSAMEIEAVAEIAKMIGFHAHLGHLTGGGTMANLEALWVAGQIHPGKRILASDAAHYTHERISAVLNLPFSKVESGSLPIMSLKALENELLKGDVGTVVATAGTTGTGHVEPIDEIISLCRKHHVRVHIDAAYGGYFKLVNFDSQQLQKDFDSLEKADSLVIDPHKHGLQPYGCGCVLFSDPSVGRFYLHDSPYTYFTSNQLHLGEISLECSRPGAAAVALWTTQKRFPLTPGGEMSAGLESCINAAKTLYASLENQENWLLPYIPDLDILVYAPLSNSISQVSSLSQKVFDLAAEKGLHLALYKMRSDRLVSLYPEIELDTDDVTCLRSTLMKWNHIDHIDEIASILQLCFQKVKSN